MVKIVTDDEFDDIFRSKEQGLIVLDFFAPWCGPCKMISPVLDKVAETFKDNDNVVICKINVDEHSRTAKQYGIRGIPSILFIKNKEIVETVTGFNPESYLTDKINYYLS
jgi:thioredoxin 1